MRLFFLFLFLCVGANASSQDKFYISPSVGILSMSGEGLKDRFYSELTVGYRAFGRSNENLLRHMGMGVIAGYGTRSGNSMYTLGAMVTPGLFSSEKLFMDASIGGGVLKTEGRDAMGTFILGANCGYYITPAFAIGIGVKAYMTKKAYTSNVSSLFLCFRF